MFIYTRETESNLVAQNSVDTYSQDKSKYKNEKQDTSDFQTTLDKEQNKADKANTRTEKEILANMKKLVEDIKSVMQTGMTKDEIKMLEEMVQEIKKKMKERSLTKEELNDMMDEIERRIREFKLKLTGQSITKAEDVKEMNEKPSSDDISSRIEKAEKDIKGFSTHLEKKDSEKIIEEIKSILRTGISPEEVKAFETLLERIKDKLRDKNYDKNELTKMIEELQEKISKFKNHMAGEAVFKAEDALKEAKSNIGIEEVKTTHNIVANNQSHNQLEFLQRIKKSQ